MLDALTQQDRSTKTWTSFIPRQAPPFQTTKHELGKVNIPCSKSLSCSDKHDFAIAADYISHHLNYVNSVPNMLGLSRTNVTNVRMGFRSNMPRVPQRLWHHVQPMPQRRTATQLPRQRLRPRGACRDSKDCLEMKYTIKNFRYTNYTISIGSKSND